MPRTFTTVRELLHWEYAKLIAESAVGSRKDFAFVQHSFKKLEASKLIPSSILRENKLLVKSGQHCSYCGAAENLHWEHIVPLSLNGPDTIDNQVLACAKCNLSKGARDPYQWYGSTRADEIPRLVLGKLLKIYYETYDAKGLLDNAQYFTEQSVERINLYRVFSVDQKSFIKPNFTIQQRRNET